MKFRYCLATAERYPRLNDRGCQAMGGARACARVCGGASRARPTRITCVIWPTTSGSGRLADAAGGAAPAIWINAQIAQVSLMRPLCCGFDGVAGVSVDVCTPRSAMTFDPTIVGP